MTASAAFEVNGRRYRVPERPVVVVCLDGSADEYLDAALDGGHMPNLQRLAEQGYRGMARAALPSFTNVNNASIVTGVPPSVHGICGNYFFDPDRAQEVMMNSARYLRAETVLAAASRAGRRVAIITAKEKLREILSSGLSGIGFSAERAAEAELPTHGIERVEELTGQPAPPIYSADASLFVLRSGAALLRAGLADFLYLSLTDYVQHAYGPRETQALEFYAAIDVELAKLLEAGAIVGMTADHGMNAKQEASGQPNVIYLEPLLKELAGAGCRVVLPITDPYVAHHGALGSFATIYLPKPALAPELAPELLKLDGITECWDRPAACRKLELPPDRIGDLVVLSGRAVALGKSPGSHDISGLHGGLRSHGGRYEEMVPFLVSESLTRDYMQAAQRDPRNFDIFDFTLNGGAPS